MKSKRSCCNGTVFRKNLTRFAPAWILYTVCLLLGLVMLSDSGVEYWLSYNIAQGIGLMGIVNFGYGLLCALLLFGDLTQPKMCNALHALPLRRETWFGTHILSGLFFSVVPTVIMAIPAVIASFFSAVEGGWQIPLFWLLGTNLQFLFFFGLAVFCMMLSGSRVGAAVIYCIVNFAAILAFYMAEVMFVPHLPGVVAQMDPFLTFCPVAMMASLDFVVTRQMHDLTGYASDGSPNYLMRGVVEVSDTWWYLWVCAAIGAVLLILALLLYRKRKLECAGDMMSTRKLDPIFLILFALVTASAFQLVYVAFIGYEAYGSAAFLWSGLVVGWFAGLMLLRRSAQVFRWKNVLGLIALAAVLALSLLINSMDPFGITKWTPRAEDVKSVTVHLSHMTSITLTEPEDIADAVTLHSLAAEAGLEGEMEAVNNAVELEDGDGTFIEIRYNMKNGSTAAREYFILIDSEAGDIARKFFSRFEPVFNEYYFSQFDEGAIYSPEDLMAMLDTPENIYVSGLALSEEQLTRENAKALLEAILADSEAGNLVQHMAFHPVPVCEDKELDIQYWSYYLQIEFPTRNLHLDIYSDCAHILAWLEDNGMMEPLYQTILEANGYG